MEVRTIDICKERERCVGCGACSIICPFKAIEMVENKEGFLYPYVDEKKCSTCGQCIRICPENVLIERTLPKSILAIKHKEDLQRKKSTSGGAFSALSDYILSKNGVVYGAVFDKEFVVHHVRGESIHIRDDMRGSKYVQSYLDDMFILVKEDLEDGRYVLFSGTPCQVAGVKSFLGKEYDRLFLVDVVCYGAPSPRLFKDYINYIKTKYGSNISRYTFRNKLISWRDGKSCIELTNKKKVSKECTSIFDYLYWSGNTLRLSCYQCQYAQNERISDVTIGDCWGIEKSFPQFEDKLGVSLVLLNTEKGQAIYEQIKKDVDERRFRDKSWQQPRLSRPTDKPLTRAQFWIDYEKNGFLYISKKYANYCVSTIIKNRLKGLFRKIMKRNWCL